MGFEELPHTADCALRIWAPDLEALFVEAALGLNELAGARLGGAAPTVREISLRSSDAESLLVAFLTDLIFFQEHENLGFSHFRLRLSGDTLSGSIEGSRLAFLTRPIKAVTFHNLRIRRTGRGQEVDIVFDV